MQINMQNEHPYGILFNEEDLRLQKMWFTDMCRMIGVTVIYRAPRPDKSWTRYSEIDSNYYEPQLVSCIFKEKPEQKTMKKLGWNSELSEQASIICVPYNLQNLQVGALFIIPSAVNPSQGRLFRVSEMSTTMIYPASVTCKLVPEYEDTTSPQIIQNRKRTSIQLLNREEEFDR